MQIIPYIIYLLQFPLFFRSTIEHLVFFSHTLYHLPLFCFFCTNSFFIFSKNISITLTGCLLYATSSVVIEYGTYVVTRVFAYIGFIILIYLFYKIVESPTNLKTGINLVIMIESLFLVMVHQVSLYQILFLLVILFLIEKIIADSNIFNFKYILFLFLLFISYQIYIAADFFNTIVKSRINIFLQESIASVRPSIQNMNEYNFLVTHLDLAIVAFFIFLGIGYILWVYRSKQLSIIGLFALLNLVFFLPNPLVMSNILAVYFRVDRFTLLIAPFMAFAAAVGLFIIFTYFLGIQTNRNYLIPLLLSIIFIFSFASIALPNSPDCKDFWWYHVRDDYFNKEELQSFNFISSHIPFGSTIVSDNPVSIFFDVKKTEQSEKLKLPYYDSKIFNYENYNNQSFGYSLLRTDEFLDNGLEFDSGIFGFRYIFQPTTTNFESLNYYSSPRNVLYESNGVRILQSI